MVVMMTFEVMPTPTQIIISGARHLRHCLDAEDIPVDRNLDGTAERDRRAEQETERDAPSA